MTCSGDQITLFIGVHTLLTTNTTCTRQRKIIIVFGKPTEIRIQNFFDILVSIYIGGYVNGPAY